MAVTRGAVCRRCGADRWYATKAGKYQCAQCSLAQNTKWVSRNRDKRRAYLKAYKQAYSSINRESIRLYNREYTQAHLDKHSMKFARRYARQRIAPGRGVTRVQRRAVLDGSLGICAYCNQRLPLELDHIEALIAGGAHDEDNLTAVCSTCNRSKGTLRLLLWLASRRVA